MKIKLFVALIFWVGFMHAQKMVLNDVVIHVGNGTVIEHGTIAIENNEIIYAGQLTDSYNSGSKIIPDVAGKHVYPGIIAMNSQVGLKEIEQARATIDVYEVGQYNPNIRSLIAFNTDSKVIPTLRSNGVLLAQIRPDGGVISGQSSVVKMAGWNWEDAVIKNDDAIYMHWPSVYAYDYATNRVIINANYTSAVSEIRKFLLEGKAYCDGDKHTEKNLRFEALRNLFAGNQKLFVEAYYAKEIISAIDMSKELNIKIVIVGGGQVYRVLELIKENNIPVILTSTFSLPSLEGEDVDMPYKLPAILEKSGILYGISISNEGSSYWNVRNLPFAAGIAAGHGLTKEQALTAITYNNAKILGIDNKYGTLETGKSATLFISDGDVLDMQSSIIRFILINGEEFPVDNWQTDLYRKYSEKYGIEVK